MAAPTIKALLAYEKNIEDPLAAYLEAAVAGLHALTPRTPAEAEPILVTPRVTIKLAVTGTGVQENQRATDNKWYRSHKLGTLTIAAVARRNDPDQSLADVVGSIRGAMLETTAAFTSANLPYYQIVFLTETGGTPSVEGANDEIFQTLTYAIEWFIKPDQWPAS